jgi:hypothetical protein
MAWHNHILGYVYFCRVKVQFTKNQLYFTHKMKTNHIAAMLLVRVLQEQMAKSKGMQYFLRTNYHMNGRYFRQDYCSKTDLNHVSVMILGMAAKLSEKEFMAIWDAYGKLLYRYYDDFEDYLREKVLNGNSL